MRIPLKKCLSLFIGIAILFVASCTKEQPITDFQYKRPLLPEEPFKYSQTPITATFIDNLENKEVGNHPFLEGSSDQTLCGTVNHLNASNPCSDELATLGRVLFYDPALSKNHSVSCGSCHHQQNGFADNKAASMGFGGATTPRNSMAIANVNFSKNLFWDSRVSSPEDLILLPIQNHIEMGMEDLSALEKKLSSIDYYPTLFENAFGNNYISSQGIAEAMGHFLRTIVSLDSKFDAGVNNEFSNFSALERMGKELFYSQRTQCSQCHAGTKFAAPENTDFFYLSSKGTANIGLDAEFADNGRGNGQFKIPTLRNVALTAPYMHDGRFSTLSEVIDHYDHGIADHPNLDSKLRDANGAPQNLHLNSFEKQALVAFLQTLTDNTLPTDEKYSNPFDY